MIQQIRHFELAIAAGLPVTISDTSVSLPTATLPRLPANKLRANVDVIKYVNGKVLCQGWAFSHLTLEPAKRIFLAHRGKIIGVAQPKLRVDVRQKLALIYDNGGFSITAETQKPVFDQEAMQLLVATDNGIVVREVKCISAMKSQLVNLTKVSESAATLTLSANDNAAKAITFRRDRDIRIVIDTHSLTDRRLKVIGWCLNPKQTEQIFDIGLVVGGQIVVLPFACREQRPDVASTFDVPSNQPNTFGFRIEHDLTVDPTVEISAVSLIAIKEDSAQIRPIVERGGLLSKFF